MADLTDVIIDGDPYDEEDDSSSTVFLGATANKDGEQGDVPKPLAGQQNATLFGDGKWKTLLYDALARYENPSNGRSNTYTGDLNDITQNCIVNTDGNNANLPSGITNWGFVITLVHSNQATYASQIYMTMNIDGTKRSVWFRDKDNGTWRDWKAFATASSLPTSGSSYLAGDETWKSDTANLVTNYTTQDDSETTDIITPSGGETAISTLESGANHARLFNKISRCFLNVRKLINTVKRQWNVIGQTWATGEAVQVNWHRLYNGKWYRCLLAHTTSSSILPTNTTYWQEVTVDSEITGVQNNISSLLQTTTRLGYISKPSTSAGYVSLALSESFRNYKFVLVTASYYDTGRATYGCICLPSYTARSLFATDAGCMLLTRGNGQFFVRFSSSTNLEIKTDIDPGNTAIINYIVAFGIK